MTVTLKNAACQGRFDLLVSPAIIREMAKVLRFDFAWQDDRVHNAKSEQVFRSSQGRTSAGP
jgi:hypothetical protein